LLPGRASASPRGLPREWPWAAPRDSHPSRPGGNAQADICEMSSRLILLLLLGCSLAALAVSGAGASPALSRPVLSSASMPLIPAAIPPPSPAMVARVQILILADGSVRVSPQQ